MKGTVWERKSDGIGIQIIGDAEAGGGRSNRSLLAVNLQTGHHFWVTPEGLGRKYEKVAEK